MIRPEPSLSINPIFHARSRLRCHTEPLHATVRVMKEDLVEQGRREFLEKTASACAAVALATPGNTLPKPMPTDDLIELSLLEASELVRSRKVSPVELTKACLARIERLNPVLNAFITVTADAALSQARDAEIEIRRGKWRGTLHGVPIGLKDIIDTTGVRTTAGSALFKDRIPDEDAEVVRRLKIAGAVLLGKQNLHEFAYGATSVPSYFGAVHNPWKPDYIAGGSSGGSAVAVSAGLCFGALGSDTGGSIRQPAAHCGIVGLKPTYGRVSTRGVIPLAWSLDHVGPMARTVPDAAAILQAIAGYDPDDPSSVDLPIPDYATSSKRNVSSIRVGVPREFFYAGLEPEIESLVNAALSVLGRLTKDLTDVTLSADGTVSRRTLFTAEAYAYHAGRVAQTPDLYQKEVLRKIMEGAGVSASAYIDERRELERLRHTVRSVFTTVDVLVTPTMPVLAVPLTEARDDNKAVLLYPRNTRPFNTYGLPAISVPCGFTSNGLPVGLQIVGPAWQEESVLRVARAYEQATNWHRRQPPL
jgi:aspartyl-tRNA(Asn)/glutamyl-tRNA(Gln) amidotransferase subunit A